MVGGNQAGRLLLSCFLAIKWWVLLPSRFFGANIRTYANRLAVFIVEIFVLFRKSKPAKGAHVPCVLYSKVVMGSGSIKDPV